METILVQQGNAVMAVAKALEGVADYCESIGMEAYSVSLKANSQVLRRRKTVEAETYAKIAKTLRAIKVMEVL